jgi:nanoRNase/pAp phosphatase (c-di-AMP/oligoRNAs hydrolase)
MDNLAFKQVREAVEKFNNIGIIIGQNSTLDSMAAALGLYLSISSMNQGKTVSVVSTNNPIVEFGSLVGVNKVKSGFSGQGGDLTVSFPYKEGEIDKASYTLENGYLNIIIKAGEQGLSFSEKDVKFTRPAGAPELLFIVGTPRLTDLGPLFDPTAFKNTTVVNIDKSPENQNFGDIVIVSPSFSSVSEIVANLIQSLSFAIDGDIARNLMQGVQSGTNNFQNPNTSPLAFEMSGFLIRNGASRQAFDQSLTSAFARSTQAQPPLQPQVQAQPQSQRTYASPASNPSTGLGQGASGASMTSLMPTPRPAVRPATAAYAQNPMPQLDWDDDLDEDFYAAPNPRQATYQPQSAQPARNYGQQNMPSPRSMSSAPSARFTPQTTPGMGSVGMETQAQREEQIERKEQPVGQNQNPPEDWLTPKIYKGSTNF